MKRSRSDSFSSYKPKQTKYARQRTVPVPKSIAFRGTPQGYYEIPVTNVFKVYYNTSSGMWQTDQNTGATLGVTGYRGFALSTSLSDVNLALGEGAVSTNITLSVPGFSSLQDVFDMCKIARLEVEIYFMQDAQPINNSATTPAAQLCVVRDYNSVTPPTSFSVVNQYADIKTCQNTAMYSRQKHVFVPYYEYAAETIDGASSTSSMNRPSTYMSTVTPGVAHRGLLGWLDVAQATGTAFTGYIYIRVKQIRRFKISR